MPTPLPPARRFFLSKDALIGIGTTIAAIGVLLMLLGWAESMRGVHSVARIFIPVGLVLLVVGLIIAAVLTRGRSN